MNTHRIGYIVIRNFRLCREVSFTLEDFTPLVGQNNTGKSAILKAISWILSPSALLQTDFFDSEKPVEVCARIDGITKDIIDMLPEQKHRTAITPYCEKGFLWIRAIATGTTAKAITKEVYDYESYSENGVPSTWKAYPTGLPQAVQSLLPEPLQIETIKDIGEDLGKAKAGTTIKGLLDEIVDPIIASHKEINSALDTVRSIITSTGENRSQHLDNFDKKASEALGGFFTGLKLNLDLPVIEAKDFFKSGDLLVEDTITGDKRRFDQMGTGAQRAIQMALLRYLADIRRSQISETHSRRLLLIDEPELYLHPQGVRRLRQALEFLSTSGFQVIFSTHSPLMLSREKAACTVIVRKDKEIGTTVSKPLLDVVSKAMNCAESQSKTLFQLGNIAEIYFSERVVVCEGKTDQRLLPLAYEKLYGHPPDMDHITFVSLGSCADIPKALPVLNAMGIKSCAVADLDFAFTHARRCGKDSLLPTEDNETKEIRALFSSLKHEHEIPLADNGLPGNSQGLQWTVSDVWALAAKDSKGKHIATSVHDELKKKGVWIWPVGCIEHVTEHEKKGESAIIQQEEEIKKMDTSQLETTMPLFKECFDWIKSI
ncbi:ATP-dependent nuclease [Candidatus Electronema sp. JC]|uniref:ATP-dependent nuclease n=1 Tax=Candidatus Electronema sp. JC TaxID=3401570 RepID=UPI003B4300B2